MILTPGWRALLPVAFKGPRQHAWDFVDHYFNAWDLASAGTGERFDLNRRNLIDPIRGIPLLRENASSFEKTVKFLARRKLEALKKASRQGEVKQETYLDKASVFFRYNQ
jgi:hypothetical protein